MAKSRTNLVTFSYENKQLVVIIRRLTPGVKLTLVLKQLISFASNELERNIKWINSNKALEVVVYSGALLTSINGSLPNYIIS